MPIGLSRYDAGDAAAAVLLNIDLAPHADTASVIITAAGGKLFATNQRRLTLAILPLN